jgi:hypothetical protein
VVVFCDKKGIIHMARSEMSKAIDNRKADNNLLRFHGDAASSAVEDAAGSYQAPSIIAAGADAQSVSVLTTLVNLCLALICIKAPSLIEKLGLTRRGAVVLAFLNLCAWVPLILAFLLSQLGIAPIWFALLWLINLMPGMLLTFQRDNWLSNLVPRNTLGRYLGQRLAIKSAFYLGAFCFLGYVLDTFSGKNLMGFAWVFIMALVVSLADFIIFTHMYEPDKKVAIAPKQEPPASQFGLLNFIGELKEKKLDIFIIFTSFFYLTVGLSGPLYAVYMLQERHFTYLSFTMIISAEFLARVVSVPFWGRFADKTGNIRVLGIVSRIIPFIPIGWLFCSNIGYLAFIQTLSGICWGAYDLCTQSYLYKVAPQTKKLRYIVYTRCLILLCTAMGGLMGYYLLKGVFLTFGSRLLSVFLISGILRALVVIYMMPRLVDLAVSYGKPTAPPKVGLQKPGMAITPKRGLFYQEPEPVEYPAKAQSRKKEIPAASKVSQHIGRRNWALPEVAVKEKKELNRPVAPVTSRRVWVQSPVTMSAATSRKSTSPLSEMGKHPGGVKTRQGLYYDSSGWSSYMKETLQSIITDSRARKNAVGLRSVPVTVSGSGVPGEIRTHDPLLRRQPLYPSELQGLKN